MAIQARCPNGHSLQVSTDLVGRTVKCPQCEAPLVVARPLRKEQEEALGTGSEIDLANDSWQPETNTSGQAVHSTPSAYQPKYVQTEQPEEPKPWATIALIICVTCGVIGTLVGCVWLAFRFVPASETLAESSGDASGTGARAAVVSDNVKGAVSDRPIRSATGADQGAPAGRGARKDENGNPSSMNRPASSGDLGSSDKLKNIFGYDRERREQLSEYLQLKGHSRGKIGILNLRILGRLNGLCKSLHLEADSNNNVEFPEKAFPEYREMFTNGTLFEDESRKNTLPGLLEDLRLDYEAGKLNSADEQLAYIVFSAFLLEAL